MQCPCSPGLPLFRSLGALFFHLLDEVPDMVMWWDFS